LQPQTLMSSGILRPLSRSALYNPCAVGSSPARIAVIDLCRARQGCWIAIVPGSGFPTPQVDVRTADSPIGPWSTPQKLFEFPEMKSDRSGYDKDTFCYATKEHVEFTDAKIALTYVCNSMVLAKTVANPEIYLPRMVILDLPH
jgi:hypothetical protein